MFSAAISKTQRIWLGLQIILRRCSPIYSLGWSLLWSLSQASKECSKRAQPEGQWGHKDWRGLDLAVLSTVLLAKGPHAWS